MAKNIVLIGILLIIIVIFRNFIMFESKQVFPIHWLILGAFVGWVFSSYKLKTKKSLINFNFLFALLFAMLFIGFGYFFNIYLNYVREGEISKFPDAMAEVISCQAGEEMPTKYVRSEGRFFPIWTYQYLEPKVTSNSESMPVYSKRKYFKSKAEAELGCKSWKPQELRKIFYDPNDKVLSLLELPSNNLNLELNLFLGFVFSVFPAVGIYFGYKKVRS